METIAAFAVLPGFSTVVCSSNPQKSSKRVPSRRTLCQYGIALIAMNQLPAAACTTKYENKTSGFRGVRQKNFARAMETGMHEYEGAIAEVKKKLFSQIAASDKVLDVGIGTGPNLRFLQRGTQVVGVDPNQYMWPYAIEKAQSCGIELHMVGGIGERLPTEDNSYDFAIVTLTLCSVRDPSLTIREILRVLKPGGQLLFIEHVIADRSHPILRAAQTLLNPLQQLFADGCHLNRDTGAILKNVGKPGFSEITYEEFNVQEFGSLIRSHIAGCARKASL